ncbi:MAG TPA: DUF2267 domain-containing protein [Vitreimonas sp.]|uniref:DUF2267 domain-containing protein n=1 Tax=Vitreimonas sp. TaxID=3069702 RepID=UPI002D44F124|nr:DUF2267 domain-containing protein [Vitreimonas sp.]HYD89289.1 DUF2267 domain-containing protein [Vitreimonas sp.]
MSANGLPVFDKTLQTTHVWLDEIMEEIGPDRHLAWKCLAVVLHGLRDRLQIGLSAHFAAELPLLVRGVYYHDYSPARQPDDCDLEEFLEDVDDRLFNNRPTDPRAATAAVFATLSRHIPPPLIRKVQQALPKRLRTFWLDAADGVEPPPPPRFGRLMRARRPDEARVFW